ncbi:MAG: GMC family oxidoreductase N-terminal domain-containing protein [Polyangiaceae bacterium]
MTSKDFDYIVVGAGTAGCVVAARLSEDPSVRVALIEAGGTDTRPDVMIPGAASLLHRSSADWKLYTEPMSGLRGRRIYYPRGKVVGGSGSTNTLIYMRGAREDYDGWQRDGADGWGFDDVLPFFKRAERCLFEDADPALQGKHGPLPVIRPSWSHPLWHAFVQAGVACGLPHNNDFNRHSIEGVGLFQFNIENGLRMSTARAYLSPARKRSNLEVVTGATAQTLLFESRRCVGVQLRRGREIEQLRARREVLLCAGAIASPQLLMFSGIGPAEHLVNMGRPVVLDQPMVGEQLHDHPLLPMSDLGGARTINSTFTDVLPVVNYLTKRDGPLSVPMPGAGGFARTNQNESRPDVQFHFAAGWTHNLYDLQELPKEDGYTICVTVCRPRSRGRLRLGGTLAVDPPVIELNYFEHADDLETMVRGVRLAQKIFDAAPFDAHRKRPNRPDKRLSTDDEIESFIRLGCESNYHPVGSCRMGREGESVVDASLRVRGIESLRVIDGSVMPSITTGNTNAPIVMIAEKGADLVKQARS